MNLTAKTTAAARIAVSDGFQTTSDSVFNLMSSAIESVATMSQGTAGNILEMALQRHKAGAFGEAERLYTQFLSTYPNHPQGLHLFGLLAHQTGRHAMAEETIRRAIAIQPDFPEAYTNLAMILQRLGRLKEAIIAHQQALELRPNFLPAYGWLCEALRADGQLSAAIEVCRRAVAIEPQNPEVYNNLGNALNDAEHIQEAIAVYNKAIQLNPRFPLAYNNLGTSLSMRGLLEEAIECYRRAIELDPQYAEAYNNLGVALQEQRDHAGALAAFQHAVSLRPNFTSALRNVGYCMFKTGRIAEAIPWFERAISTNPAMLDAQLELAEAYEACDRHADALKVIKNLAALMPTDPTIHSRLIQAMQMDDSSSKQEIREQMQRWRSVHAKQGPPSTEYTNKPDPDRRLRVAYLFNRAHPLLEALLGGHDRNALEVFAYSHVKKPDPATRRVLRSAAQSRRIPGRSIAQIADAIKKDQIDLLVDTTGHTPHNCLLIMAHAPAPVQIWQDGCGDPAEPSILRFEDLPADMDMAHYARSLEATYRSVWRKWCSSRRV